MRSRLQAVAQSARDALGQDIEGLAARTRDAGRIARCLVLSSHAAAGVVDVVFGLQRSDGGWTDIPESTWATALLVRERDGARATLKALDWLVGQRASGGGWGRNAREGARIPVTGIILRFLGNRVGEDRDWKVLGALWAEDLASEVRLSYKGAFYLLATHRSTRPSSLVSPTMDYLRLQSNPDGGFGPWKGHPIGSDPWSTGICLVGLCSHPDLADKRTIERAVKWLCKTQLPSGYWPYHFIDEGSAYAYWGLTEAIKFLEAH